MPIRSGDLAAPAARCLPLLPSGPGGVHRATLRETRSSTRHEPPGAHLNGIQQPPRCLRGLADPKLVTQPPVPPPSTRHPTQELAERPGFEPGVEFPPHTLSRRAPSTTRTPLHTSGIPRPPSWRPPSHVARAKTLSCDDPRQRPPPVQQDLAERVGFEPTWELPPNPLSRRARYDRFGTSPIK